MRIMTIDLEFDWAGNKKIDCLKNDLPKILDLLDKNNTTATFFTVGELAEMHPEIIEQIPKHHEIACHTYFHNNENLDLQIKLAKKTFKKMKINLKGFRCFGFQIPNNLGELLVKHDFIHDSSLAIGSFPGRFNNILGIKHPYKASKEDIKNKGQDLIEFPVPSIIPPFFLSGFSYYKMIYPFSSLLNLPYIFYFHPNDLSSEKPKGEYGNFLIQKLMGLHREKAWKILEEVLKKDNNWVSCEQYLKHNKID